MPAELRLQHGELGGGGGTLDVLQRILQQDDRFLVPAEQLQPMGRGLHRRTKVRLDLQCPLRAGQCFGISILVLVQRPLFHPEPGAMRAHRLGLRHERGGGREIAQETGRMRLEHEQVGALDGRDIRKLRQTAEETPRGQRTALAQQRVGEVVGGFRAALVMAPGPRVQGARQSRGEAVVGHAPGDEAGRGPLPFPRGRKLPGETACLDILPGLIASHELRHRLRGDFTTDFPRGSNHGQTHKFLFRRGAAVCRNIGKLQQLFGGNS